MIPIRAVAAALGALAFGLAAPVINGRAAVGETAITCTNPFSGTTWQIAVDYNRKTVDGNPAEVSDDEISWHDRKDGGNYTLDRKFGKLTVVVASSTGGYFLYDRCKLD